MTITARDLISLALKQAGILGVGQTALAEDINDCFQLLSQMISQWQVRRWMVPALIDISAIGNDQKSNPLGPGQYWNVGVRPNDVKGGYIVQLNTGNTPISLQLRKIFSYEEYIRIAVKGLNSLPDHFFYDNQWPYGNVFIWPIPNSTYEVHLLVEAPLNFPLAITNPPSAGTGLDTPFTLPAEYQEAVFYNLSLRISAMYQFPATDDTKQLAKTSLNTIVVANTQVPKMQMPIAIRRAKAFNLFNADGY
jgi:hypothetical protein